MALLRRLSIRPLAVGVGLSIVLAGCSGGKNGPRPSGDGATVTTVAAGGNTNTSSTPSDQSTPGPDDQHLQAIVLTPADLPAGWVANPSTSTPMTEAASSLALAQCLGQRNIGVDLVASVMSSDFSKGTLVITSSARSYLSDDDVATATAAFANPKASSCYQTRLAAPGGAAGNVTVKVAPGSAGGPGNVVATASISTAGSAGATGAPTAPPSTVKGSKPTTRPATTVKPSGLTGTIVFITGPRVTVEIQFLGVGQAVPAALQSELIAKVAARAGKG